jgi:putative colanic acid biosynthesis acetyltransferase WcaF
MGTNLAEYNNANYNPGASFFKRMLWFYCNIVFFKSSLFPFYALKTFLLRVFGARIGKGVIIKPGVNIKYPWYLKIGDHVWIGEDCWIDNLVMVQLGSNTCLSQGCLLLTGNHDYKDPGFGLIAKGIILEDGVWIGAGAVVCSGVICGDHSILTVGSVATNDLEPKGIYQGNPAIKSRTRII